MSNRRPIPLWFGLLLAGAVLLISFLIITSGAASPKPSFRAALSVSPFAEYLFEAGIDAIVRGADSPTGCPRETGKTASESR